jgi:hypothetical protein
MILNKFELVISEQEVNRVMKKYLPPSPKFSDIYVTLEPDNFVLTGKIKLLFAINFKAMFKISHTEEKVAAQLVHLEPLQILTESVKHLLLEKMVEHITFAEADLHNDTIYFRINDIVKQLGLSSALKIQSLRISQKQLALDLEGELFL